MGFFRFLLIWLAANTAAVAAILLVTFLILSANTPPDTPHTGAEGDWHGMGEFYAAAAISVVLTMGLNLLAGVAWLVHSLRRANRNI